MQIFTPATSSHKAFHHIHLHAAYKIIFFTPLNSHTGGKIYIIFCYRVHVLNVWKDGF